MIEQRHLSAFCCVVETGGFSTAAAKLGVGQPAISKLIGHLEDELAATLFIRSTRKLTLTHEGERVLVQARRVLDAYADLIAAGQSGERLAGVVRLTCPHALASRFLIKALAEFRHQHPDIDLQLRITDDRLDLEVDAIDVAIRVGDPTDENAKAKYIGQLPRIATASPEYLKKSPMLRYPDDLSAHRCIIVGKNTMVRWDYIAGKRGGSVEVCSSMLVDNHIALRDMVLAGYGVGLAASFLFMDDQSMIPGLVRVFPSVEFAPLPLNILYRGEKHIPARVRALIDFVAAELAPQPWVLPRA